MFTDSLKIKLNSLRKDAITKKLASEIEAKAVEGKYILGSKLKFNEYAMSSLVPHKFQGSFFYKVIQQLASKINRQGDALEINLEGLKRALYMLFNVE
jgi:hypothetical protein